MGVAPRSSADRARASWLARFGAEPPVFARDLLDRITAVADSGRVDSPGIRQAAQALGVLRAHHGHAVAGLVEDMVALRALLPHSPANVLLVDNALTAATSAYVDELTAILESRATRDPLTGLPNRAALAEALEHEIAGAARTSPPALLLLDLDGFKGVNDSDGHLAGDAVLVGVADVLREQVRDGDLACRLGGDEFAVLLPRTSQAHAVKVARRLLTASRKADALASASARVSFSIGVGWLADPHRGDDLVAIADAALYAAKGSGGDALQVGTHQADTEAEASPR
jgi:diguanylate cyclase (GGDEF)-like protein